MLFRIAFMVEEKKLGPVLALLAGKTVNMEPPVPVSVADDRPYHELIDLSGKKQIRSDEIRDQIVAAGKKASALNYATKQLVDRKLIKPAGKRGLFNVLGGK